jgi:hypothetical protein
MRMLRAARENDTRKLAHHRGRMKSLPLAAAQKSKRGKVPTFDEMRE